MSESLVDCLFGELEKLPLVDPHSHINPHAPASKSLADIIGYHYYTELAHSAGLPKSQIEQPGLSPKERVARLVPKFRELENTVQWEWLLVLCREFLDFKDESITSHNWESLFDRSVQVMSAENWPETVLQKSRLDRVFLTNDFDDPLTGFDTRLYVPCLRTDDLVFHFTNPVVRNRLSAATGQEVHSLATLRAALRLLFEHFHKSGAKAAAISLPPSFSPAHINEASADPILLRASRSVPLTDSESNILSNAIFWTIAELASEFRLPFDLMIGVNRKVYPEGVFQGQDLFDQRVSLIEYRQLFNSFPTVTFPISVLAQASNQELVSYSWIFPNVVTHGHWWYSNIPACIESDLRLRLQALPCNKQIGYYSDMYKLEFALPKFRMFRRSLAKSLAADFVIERGWTETRALQLGFDVLRGNVERVFNIST